MTQPQSQPPSNGTTWALRNADERAAFKTASVEHKLKPFGRPC